MGKAISIVALALAVASTAAHATSYTFVPLYTPAGDVSYAWGINNLGEVVGTTGFIDPQTVGTGNIITAYGATLWNGPATSYLATPPGYSSVANGINDSGTVVGQIQNGVSGYTSYSPMAWVGSNATQLGTLGGNNGAATGISNSGQVVGYSDTLTGQYATTWSGTTPTKLGPVDNTIDSRAYGINNTGQIVGATEASPTTAMIWSGSNSINLGPGFGSASVGFAINNTGDVVGYSYVSGNEVATLWNGAGPISLGTLGGSYSWANAINNDGVVVGGAATTAPGITHAFMWSNGAMTDINAYLTDQERSSGWVLDYATGINDNGWIAGVASNTVLGEDRAFLLEVAAVPEARAYAMLLTGLGLVGFVAHRKKKVS